MVYWKCDWSRITWQEKTSVWKIYWVSLLLCCYCCCNKVMILCYNYSYTQIYVFYIDIHTYIHTNIHILTFYLPFYFTFTSVCIGDVNHTCKVSNQIFTFNSEYYSGHLFIYLFIFSYYKNVLIQKLNMLFWLRYGIVQSWYALH